MEELIKLLNDGKSRTIEMLAIELNTSTDKVKRDIEFLERTGVVKRIVFSGTHTSGTSCNGCTGCGTGGKTCAGCMPEGGFQNMGVMWEVVK
ncbi:MAG: DeoR family transcriptional regulator [Lachnospiraceae bacterium]|nr:DeoR family transcriptional regulator [Lachnospiraceae bacterium]